MKAVVTIEGVDFLVDFSKPIDISIPLQNSKKNPIAWYLDPPKIDPVRIGNWVGKVSEGQSATNFNTIIFNPHAHGTHTECLGHITYDFYSINAALKTFIFFAQVISIVPEKQGADLVITKQILQNALKSKGQEALVIRTLPNAIEKCTKKYSNTNPAYLTEEAAAFLRISGIKHLLIDLPSVDKEKDAGKLVAHKAFWNVKNTEKLNNDARLNATITEFIFVPEKVQDGFYLLNLQIAPFENDASPSKPILYSIETR